MAMAAAASGGWQEGDRRGRGNGVSLELGGGRPHIVRKRRKTVEKHRVLGEHETLSGA